MDQNEKEVIEKVGRPKPFQPAYCIPERVISVFFFIIKYTHCKKEDNKVVTVNKDHDFGERAAVTEHY